MAFTIGIGGMIVTSPGVAWADGVTGSTDSTSTESNTEPASTEADNQDAPTGPSTSLGSTTEPSKPKSASTRKHPVSTFLSETLSETVTSLRGNLVARSPRAAVTPRRDADPVDTPTTPEETPPTEAERFSLEKFVDGLPVAHVLESFLPPALTNPGYTGRQPQLLGGTEPIQQLNSGDLAAAHVGVAHVDPEQVDPVDGVLPGIEDLTNAFPDIRDLLPDLGDLTGGALPPLPQLPFPNADSPEPVTKAWACLCSLVAEARPVTDQFSDLFNDIFAPIVAGPDPGGAPTNSPLDWAVFAWVRRQADEALSSDIMQAVQAYALQGWQQFLVSCSGPTEGLPAEFERTVLVDGLSEPLDFVFLPNDPENPNDGGILIAEKGGAIKLYKEGQEGTTTVVELPVKTDFESGIGGIEVDPDYATNHYVYVAYTNGDTNEDMLSRFTLEGTQEDILASQVVLIRTNDAAGTSHHGGEIYYEENPNGKDYIYWAKGDNNRGENAQELTNLHGKIMRVHADGTIPEDNPFVDTPGARPEIYAIGLRNPFRFTTTPDGQLLVGDVGGADWEELNLVTKGANYGWPNAEGTTIGSPEYTNPVYTYAHATQPAGTGSITSVMVYTGDNFGEEYKDKVFIADYTAGWIKVLDLGPNYSTFVSEQTLDGQAGTPVKLVQGPDGNIYQLNIYPGELSVIAPAGGNRAPTAVIGATPSNGLAPLTVDFSSEDSTDPEGTPLSYNWDFGDGTSSTEANPTHTYTTDGTKVVTLTVSDGQKTDQATQNITVGSTPPKLGTITLDSGPTYNPGDTIAFSTTDATDDQETLPDSAYTWTVLFHHVDHVHPAATIVGQKSGSIIVPTESHGAPGEETWYTVTLTVTDSSGLSTTSEPIEVRPNEASAVGRGLGTTVDEAPSNL